MERFRLTSKSSVFIEIETPNKKSVTCDMVFVSLEGFGGQIRVAFIRILCIDYVSCMVRNGNLQNDVKSFNLITSNQNFE